MIVVSDTSPLSYLHQIGRLQLLQALYGRVVIPTAVEKELRAAAELHEGFDWSLIDIVEPKDVQQVAALCEDLDRGEAEAIVVALEIQADILLIDEVGGRETARRMGLRRTGLLGVLLEAKQRGLVGSVRHEIDKLLSTTTFRIHSQVHAELLRLAGEAPEL